MRGSQTLRSTVRGLRRRPLLAAVAALAALVVAGVAVEAGTPTASGASTTPSSAGAVKTTTTKVVRTDLATTQQVYGALGFAGAYTILNPAGTTPQALAQARQAVAAAQASYNGAATAVADTQSVNAASASGTLTALTTAKNTQALDQAEAAEASAAQALVNAQAQATAAAQTASVVGGVYSQVPAPGQQVHQGQTLYSVDGRPVPLLYGTVTPWRAIQPGVSDGPDVAELMGDLAQLGFGTVPQPATHYGPAAVAQVERWQASLGVPQTGEVRLGEVAVEPEALRVTAVHVSAGAAVQPGQAVLDATGLNPVVTVPLGVDKEHLAHAGDAVQVDLPDGTTTVPGHVTSVSDVATAVPNSNGGPANAPATSSSNNGPQATVAVTIALDGFTQQNGIDQEPVTVELTDQRASGVLAVPVNSLLALAGGGYGVRVLSEQPPRVVPVQTGLFANTLVQVSGTDLGEGMTVEVPAP
ncbi:MAG: hypothetical protein JOZ04_16025 [Acidimicrobiia bacterium]|nr:hypothetical protein [Acidimicrobiia bacterium]